MLPPGGRRRATFGRSLGKPISLRYNSGSARAARPTTKGELVAEPRPVAGRVGVALRSVTAQVRLGRIREGRHLLLASPAPGLRQQLLADLTRLGQGQWSDLAAVGRHLALKHVQLHGFSRRQCAVDLFVN